MPTFYFQLGNTPELSLQELAAVLPDKMVSHLTPEIASIEDLDETSIPELMDSLGGTVKITRLEKTLALLTPEQLEQEVSDYLATTGEKVTFAVAELGRDHLSPLSVNRIKSELEKQGLKARYIEGSRRGLSAAVLSHKAKVIEIVIMNDQTHTYLTRTMAVQNIDAWSFRDRGKPYADRRKGMLPPKVARMMLNIALGTLKSDKPAPVVYDPFCGTGTVLLEAILKDCRILGSDVDPDSVNGTRTNIEWFIKNLEESPESVQKIAQPVVVTGDVTRVALQQLRVPADCIVTEPFLGKPTPQPSQLPNIFRGLGKLYWGAFKHWTELLADEATLAVVFPYVISGKTTYNLESLIDKIAPLGYTMTSEPVLYHRPLAVVQRQIHFLRFKRN